MVVSEIRKETAIVRIHGECLRTGNTERNLREISRIVSRAHDRRSGSSR